MRYHLFVSTVLIRIEVKLSQLFSGVILGNS